MNKSAARKMLRTRFVGMEARDEQSKLMCRHITESDIYKSAGVIGAYMPMPHEADITPVLQHVLLQGKSLALPLCGPGRSMTFHSVKNLNTLQPNAWGIPEPDPDAPLIPLEDIDLLLVPLEGIDAHGYRLGKGGGYYDRALQGQTVFTLGCALSWQWTDEIPRELHDMPLCGCADARGIHIFSNNRQK